MQECCWLLCPKGKFRAYGRGQRWRWGSLYCHDKPGLSRTQALESVAWWCGGGRALSICVCFGWGGHLKKGGGDLQGMMKRQVVLVLLPSPSPPLPLTRSPSCQSVLTLLLSLLLPTITFSRPPVSPVAPHSLPMCTCVQCMLGDALLLDGGEGASLLSDGASESS